VSTSERERDFDDYRDEFGVLAPIPASHGQRRIPDEGFDTGPSIGERLPDFALRSSSGEVVDFHADRAGQKAAVVFFRSAVWCPICMTQLVDLQEAMPKFRAAGIRLYAVSYDEPEALADFARHHGIEFPLLADVGSRVIDRFGIRNHFVTVDQIPYYGIPFPGTYLVDEAGLVTQKFFQRSFAQRESAEAVIDGAVGEILLGQQEPMTEAGGEHIRVTAAYHGGGGKLKFAAPGQVVVRFDLAPGVHIYGDPVPTGMVATQIRVSGPPGLHVGETVSPPTGELRLPGVDAVLPVWEGRVDFVVPVHVDDRIASLTDALSGADVPIEIRVDYQGCDDKTCRIPQSETLSLRVPLAPHVGNALAGDLAGTTGTTMRSRWFMLRMIARSWVRSPVRGLRYLLGLWMDARRGPAGRGGRSVGAR